MISHCEINTFFCRMMLLVALSSMLILLKNWMQSKKLLCLFQWIHSRVMSLGSLLVLLD
jgi:hypothetical protein